MRLTKGNIWSLPFDDNSAICVTTNGIVKRDGKAVMGAGIAKQARDMFGADAVLGKKLTRLGNHVHDLGLYTNKHQFHLISFPTKHDWHDQSDLNLIRQSAKELVALTDQMGFSTVYLTPPGCALGRLDWETQVRPVLEGILDDRFVVTIFTPRH